MGLILLDSTVIVGFLDADDALHEVTVAKFKEVIGSHPLVASAVSYAEVMTGVSHGHHPEKQVERFFDVVIKELLPVDRQVAARAGQLRGKRISLRMPDALILATADLHEDIETVLCADAEWPKVKGLSCKVELLKVDADPPPAGRPRVLQSALRPSGTPEPRTHRPAEQSPGTAPRPRPA